MASSSSLRPLFARTLRASLAAPLVLTGCGLVALPPGTPGTPDEPACTEANPSACAEGPGVDVTGYAAPGCDNSAPTLSGLSPAVRPDLVQLRRFTFPEVSPPAVVSSVGTACATASQPAACQSALAKLQSSEGFHKSCGSLCSSYYLATTRGDEVAAHTSLDALKRFLGPIDTASEAVLLAYAEGLDVNCTERKYGAVKQNPDGTFQVLGTLGHTCGAGTAFYQVVMNVSSAGGVSEVQRTLLKRGDPNCAIGRRPDGLHATEDVTCDTALGRYFAQAAHLEAASIQAFLRLHEELARHGADADLRDAALASAVDEVLHTDVSTRLARRFGATPPAPRVEPLPPRSLFEVALENAVEGCTRETYGALVAHYQALHARDPEVREAMGRIAEDETRHAELSWAVEGWAHARLSEPERAVLLRARREAVETLRAELALPLDAELVTQAGLPPPEVAQALLASLERELWA